MKMILDAVESVGSWISSFGVQSDFASYCQLETGLDETTLVSRSGAMISILDLAGSRNVVGKEEFEYITNRLRATLTAYLQRPGHSFQVVFERDGQRTASRLEEIIRPSRESAKRIGLDLWQDLIDDYVAKLTEYCADESALIVVSTHSNAISKEEYKAEFKETAAAAKEAKVPRMDEAQSPMAIIRSLINRHHSMVEALRDDLRSTGLHAVLLDAHTAVRRIRAAVDPEFTSESWRPVLPGDKIPARLKPRQNDCSDIYLPKLSLQCVPRKAVDEDGLVKIGSIYYGTILMEVGPQEENTHFMQLFRRLHHSIPWRISFEIAPGGIDAVRFKSTMVAVTGFMSDVNKQIKKSFMALDNMQKNGECIVALRIGLSTWGRDKRAVEKNLSTLAKAVQGWGVTDVTDDGGDPFGMFASVLPGFSSRNLAPAMPAPLSDVVKMLPIQRPASPWEDGAMLFRSADGKPFPFQPGSSRQDAWVDLISASMGSGKSVLLNALNRATCLMPGLQRLPLITIVDVAPSSRGVIDMLKAALPADRKHEAAYYKLRMSHEFAVNPFDTQLGCRRPTTMERAFLVNLLTMLATPVGATKPYESSADLAGLLVDEIYKQFSDEFSPRRYEPTVEVEVDKAIEEIGFERDEATSWFEIEDALFVAGRLHEATLAHRQAVPRLSDLMSIVRSDVVRDTFARTEDSAVRINTGETLIDAMSRVISSAMREYPVLATTTRFDLGLARVVSLDLDEVARGGGDAAKKQAAIMYMLARQLAAKNYYLMPEMLDASPDLYHSYHRPRIETIREEMKAIRYDEFHRTGGMEALRELVLLDMREGRKWNIQITLISQFLGDFDKDMVDAASAVYILKADTAKLVEEAQRTFGLSNTAVERLKADVHGPGKGGANFLVRYKTKAGDVVQILTNTMGSMELWAASTTSEDVALRNKLYNMVGERRAWSILAANYPAGSAKPDIETRRKLLGEEDDANVIEALARELVTNAGHLHGRED